MPYFISPLSSQLTVRHKLSWFFFLFLSLPDLPFCCLLSYCTHSLSCWRYLSFALSPPRFCHFRQGNVEKKKGKKTLSCSISFCALSIKKGNSVLSRRRLSACCCLKLMKTIFHLHGVIVLGVAAQVSYGKINIMEGLTLLSRSGQDQCVCYWTGYVIQTRSCACHVCALEAKMYTVCKRIYGA